jgi:DNA N-6-adenine-methyltransferase (Dam)
MHLTTRTIGGIQYHAIEQSYRSDGRTCKRTIASLGCGSKHRGKPPTAFARLKKLDLSPEQIHKFTCDIIDREPPDGDCWQTPDTEDFPIVRLVKEMFGGQIGLDPTTIATNPTDARHFFTMRDNALWQSWEGKGPVFMNPPFSAPVPFLEKLLDAYRSGHIPASIVLLPSRCMQDRAAGALLEKADATCIWRERIQYVDATTSKLVRGVNFASSLYCFSSEGDRFKQIFSPWGRVI